MTEITTTKKLWYLFTPEQRYKAFILLVLMFVAMLIETLGVGLVIPLLTFVTKDNLYIEYPELQRWLDIIGNPSQKELIIYGMSVFIGVYAIKVIFLGFFNWWQARFVFGLSASYSKKLFTDYLQRPYAFHLQRNSAQLIHNVTAEVGMFVRAVQSSLIILSEVSVFLGISVLLLIAEPRGALFVLIILGAAGWLIHKCTKGFVLKWGQARQFHDGLRLQHLQQGLGSAKDIKLLGRENEFIDQYEVHNLGSARINCLWAILQVLPRLWLEFLVVLSLSILVLIMMSGNVEPGALVTVLGLFAVAAFRVMPSVNRVLTAFQGIRFALPAIDKLYDEFANVDLYSSTKETNQLNTNENLVLDKEINLKKITYSYPNTNKSVLSDINLTIKKETSIGFIGTTGAGKSTLVDVILGLLTPTEGEILVDGINIQHDLRQWQDQIGYVPQSIYITDDSVRRNVAFGLSNEQIDDELIWKALRSAQLETLVKELPEGLDTVLGEHGVLLSGGQRQRIGIARALYHKPNVLVLDEATSSLDVETESEFREAVKELHGNKTILIVAHRLSTIENCDWVYRLENGRVIEQGSPDNILYKQTLKN